MSQKTLWRLLCDISKRNLVTHIYAFVCVPIGVVKYKRESTSIEVKDSP